MKVIKSYKQEVIKSYKYIEVIKILYSLEERKLTEKDEEQKREEWIVKIKVLREMMEGWTEREGRENIEREISIYGKMGKYK